MYSAGIIRRRLLAGDTIAQIAADLGIAPDTLRKRAARIGVKSSEVLGHHRRRPKTKVPKERAA